MDKIYIYIYKQIPWKYIFHIMLHLLFTQYVISETFPCSLTCIYKWFNILINFNPVLVKTKYNKTANACIFHPPIRYVHCYHKNKFSDCQKLNLKKNFLLKKNIWMPWNIFTYTYKQYHIYFRLFALNFQCCILGNTVFPESFKAHSHYILCRVSCDNFKLATDLHIHFYSFLKRWNFVSHIQVFLLQQLCIIQSVRLINKALPKQKPFVC